MPNQKRGNNDKKECVINVLFVAWDITVWLCSGTRWAARNRPSITRRPGRSANCTCSCIQAGARGTITVTAPRRRSERKSAHQSSREVLAHPNFHISTLWTRPRWAENAGASTLWTLLGKSLGFNFFFFCFCCITHTSAPGKLTTR